MLPLPPPVAIDTSIQLYKNEGVSLWNLSALLGIVWFPTVADNPKYDLHRDNEIERNSPIA